jgi:membrane-associated phospholipid phosphatase
MGQPNQSTCSSQATCGHVRVEIGWMLAIAFAVLGVISSFWDLEISRLATSIKIPGDLRKGIHLSEAFAHFSGVVAILGTLLLVDLKNRSRLIQACLLVTTSGIVSNAAKYIIPRYRPHSLEEASIPIQSSLDTWGVPWSGSWFEEAVRSFPSGHSATAVALAIALSVIYPRGRWVFVIVAFMACLQRLVSGAHFLSDIMAGSGIAVLVSLGFYRFAFRDTHAVKTVE